MAIWPVTGQGVEISMGGGGGQNFKFGFGNEMTHPWNGSEIG